ncbi:hypothetical protein ADIARSV_3010 [Arcticibacter svalbardensis MN12-7]|uniref:Uncharacterized protein n=1 Tax=Arcticibacter svalbardensis MN12-7 TaxID=1150600 RepID=R9GQ76_9SPHI|nr:hypothetical protein ADIARSV_3010 [Arcticibacter svalbardensis MN12-7]
MDFYSKSAKLNLISFFQINLNLIPLFNTFLLKGKNIEI